MSARPRHRSVLHGYASTRAHRSVPTWTSRCRRQKQSWCSLCQHPVSPEERRRRVRDARRCRRSPGRPSARRRATTARSITALRRVAVRRKLSSPSSTRWSWRSGTCSRRRAIASRRGTMPADAPAARRRRWTSGTPAGRVAPCSMSA